MKVRLLRKRLLPKKCRNYNATGEAGEVVEVPYKLAMRWVQKNIAIVESGLLSEKSYSFYPVGEPIEIETNDIDNYLAHEKVSIVIPVFNALEYLKKCLKSLLLKTQNFELIIIDNGSDAITKAYLKRKQEKLGFMLETNERNMGFSYACNQGIKLATCDYILLLNSDTMFSDNWLGKLMMGFKMPDAGIIGATTCFSAGVQCDHKLKNKRLQMSQSDIDNVVTQNGIVEAEVYGFCYLISKKLVDTIGVFDEARYPIGSAEEKDYTWRAYKAGFKSYWVKDSYVHHFGNKTFNEMGIIPGVVRKENDRAFEARKSDKNIYIENTSKISRPLIPILTIVLDRLEYTKKSITSILENTNYPFKLFIFNNGSDNDTTAYLESINDSRIEMFHSRENIGLVPAMNMFFDRFKDCRYVAKVDNDTVVPEGWLIKLKEVMDAYPLFTVQADHYLAMPFRIETNDDFYKHLFSTDFKDGRLYFYKNSGGTGQLIRRSVIDKPVRNATTKGGKGGLSGWCNMQVQKYKEYPSAFYSGVWIERLDQIDTNRYKPVSDYPEYDKMIKKMRPWGLGYANINLDELKKIKNEMRAWFNKNDSGMC